MTEKQLSDCKSRINSVYQEFYGKDDQNKKLGAYLTAEIKSIKRDFLTSLIDNYMQNQDVTPTAAMQIARNVLGRGISNKYLLDRFGKPERTAANKSLIFQEDTKDLEQVIQSEMNIFIIDLKRIAVEVKNLYK